MARRVLVEERARGRLEHVDECAPVAPSALVAGAEVCLHVGAEAPEPLGQRGEARLLLLVRESEVADADLVGVGHLRLRPHARVLARERGHRDVGREPDALTAGDGEQLLARDALLLHDPHGLVRTEDLRSGVPRDRLRAPEVVEVRVADDDPIGAIDATGREADRRRRWHAVHVRVEEDDEVVDRQTERRATEPVERRRHDDQPLALPWTTVPFRITRSYAMPAPCSAGALGAYAGPKTVLAPPIG